MPMPSRASAAYPVLLVGALAPLSRPGWVEAGTQLIAGMRQAAADINEAGGIDGLPIRLVERDTAADPALAEEIVESFAEMGVAGIVGEYHSVVARAVAGRAEALGLPFLCSSAVLDRLVDRPARWVARIAPPQSLGWSLYADFLASRNHLHVAAAFQPSLYWRSGIDILRERLNARGGSVRELDLGSVPPEAVAGALAAGKETALLVLAGHPEPAIAVVRCVRADPRLQGLLIGAPAGQPEFAEWPALLGEGASGVPFLRYLPPQPTERGVAVMADLEKALPMPPSFIALEGYDALLAFAEVLRLAGRERKAVPEAWGRIDIAGTRGRLHLRRQGGSLIWQWPEAPLQVAERAPSDPASFRVLYP